MTRPEPSESVGSLCHGPGRGRVPSQVGLRVGAAGASRATGTESEAAAAGQAAGPAEPPLAFSELAPGTFTRPSCESPSDDRDSDDLIRLPLKLTVTGSRAEPVISKLTPNYS